MKRLKVGTRLLINYKEKVIAPKFRVGDRVNLLQDGVKFNQEVTCPICQGRYTAPNPNFGKNGDNRVDLVCSVCNEGKILVGAEKCKVRSKEIYIIEKMSMNFSKLEEEDIVKTKYSLRKSPTEVESVVFDTKVQVIGSGEKQFLVVDEENLLFADIIY